MRAITLHQPWASLIMSGRKTVETRSWGTVYRGPLAIHAGKTVAKPDDLDEYVLGMAGGSEGLAAMPTSCVLGVVNLLDCKPTSSLVLNKQAPEEWISKLSMDDFYAGNLEPCRFGWFMRVIERFDPPRPARGKQGIWEWQPNLTVSTEWREVLR